MKLTTLASPIWQCKGTVIQVCLLRPRACTVRNENVTMAGWAGLRRLLALRRRNRNDYSQHTLKACEDNPVLRVTLWHFTGYGLSGVLGGKLHNSRPDRGP